jgi:hypothetical protein
MSMSPKEDSGESAGSNFWSRRSWRGKLGLSIAGVFALLVVVGALLPSPSTDDQGTTEAAREAQPQETTAPTDEQPTAEAEAPVDEEPAAPPAPKSRPVRVLTGTGSEVRSLRLAADSPLVVTGTHQGQANFIVDLVGRGDTSGSENLFNEIGSYDGQTAVAEAASGQYRVQVDADGPWTLRFAQPLPTSEAKRLPGTLRGNGAKVRRVRTTEDLQPVIEGTHRGEANFIVDVIGYGDTTGSENLFNEIGNYDGETLLEDLPQGSYLIHVQADGPWTIKFTP